MDLEPSLGEGSLFNHLFENKMHQPHQDAFPNIFVDPTPSITVVHEVTIQAQAAVITPAAELMRRDPNPIPQADDCQQASQSASQAAQQASQSASQSIQQAQQSASEAARQASQSASQSIQQAQQTASQAIQQAQQSASRAQSSASSVVASIQSSASAAISRANGFMSNAQQSASTAQVCHAQYLGILVLRKVLKRSLTYNSRTKPQERYCRQEPQSQRQQVSCWMAWHTIERYTNRSLRLCCSGGVKFSGSCGKSYFQCPSISLGLWCKFSFQLGGLPLNILQAAASSQVSQASQQVTASQNAAVTATQAALAIVGSIIASALITILIYFLIIQHKKKAKRQSKEDRMPSPEYTAESKFPVSDQVGTTIAGSQSAYNGTRNEPGSGSRASFSLFPKPTPGDNPRDADVKTTSVPWNPSKPPKAPTLGSWLKVQDGVSPFGPIKLPTDSKSPSPLGGQLKSPLRSSNQPRSPDIRSTLPIRREPTLPNLAEQATMAAVPKNPPRYVSVRKAVPPENPFVSPKNTYGDEKYRESRTSVWTDEVPDSGPSPPLQSPPKQPVSVSKGYEMTIPSPKNPVRSTAEWLASIQNAPEAPPSLARNSRASRPSFGLPRNPRMAGGGGGGLPSRPGPNKQVKSVQGELGYIQGLNRFLPDGRASTLSRMGSGSGSDKSAETPGVGKAI